MLEGLGKGVILPRSRDPGLLGESREGLSLWLSVFHTLLSVPMVLLVSV